jgi:hypothetical protein
VSKVFVCDVCGEPFNLEEPHIEIVVPEGFFAAEDGVDFGQYDVCSTLCLRRFTEVAAPETETPTIDALMEEAAKPRSMTREEFEALTLKPEKPEPPVQTPTAEDWYPEGMRVDGRSPEQLPRIRRSQ